MYKLKIYANKINLMQLAVGFYGSDELPKAFLDAIQNVDTDFFVQHAMGLGVKRTKDGRFYTKTAATKAANRLTLYNHAGGMYLKGKHGAHVYGLEILVLEA